MHFPWAFLHFYIDINNEDLATLTFTLLLGMKLPGTRCFMNIIFLLVFLFKGVSYIRLTMGASDFMAVEPYTYDDIDSYGTDFDLSHFSIEKDKAFVLPILKEARSINPELRIMATPWSAPAWMKVSHTLEGGEMNSLPRYLETYANYFLKFLHEYENEGVRIDAITVQNEPLYTTSEYPSMGMSADLEKIFIRDHLGPLFQRNNTKTKILVFDHNWEDASYPEAIVSDGMTGTSTLFY